MSKILEVRALLTRHIHAAVFDYVVALHLWNISEEYYITAVYNDLDTVKYLIFIDANSRLWIDHAFYIAAHRGHLKVMKYLVSVGANVHIYEEGAFCDAVANGKLDAVKYLISVGVNVHACNNYAFRYGSTDVINYLYSIE